MGKNRPFLVSAFFLVRLTQPHHLDASSASLAASRIPDNAVDWPSWKKGAPSRRKRAQWLQKGRRMKSLEFDEADQAAKARVQKCAKKASKHGRGRRMTL